MLSIGYANVRGIGQQPRATVVLSIDVAFRDSLHLFKGPLLSVFMAINLHANRDGICYPSVQTICRETGYDKKTVSSAIGALTELTIQGQPVLHRIQTRSQESGRFASASYQVFPSPDELKEPVPAESTPKSPRSVSGVAVPRSVSRDTVDSPLSISIDSMDLESDLESRSTNTKLTDSLKEAPAAVQPKPSVPEPTILKGSLAPSGAGAGWDTFKPLKTKYYPVNHRSGKILNQPFPTEEMPADKAEDWKQKGVVLVSGRIISATPLAAENEPDYGTYDVISVPQTPAPRKVVFDALAQCAFDVQPDCQPGERTGSRVGMMIKELVPALNRTYSDVVNDETLAQKIRKFYQEWESSHENGKATKPKDPVAFVGQFMAWIRPQSTESSVLKGLNVA